jgi:hypothetical protein
LIVAVRGIQQLKLDQATLDETLQKSGRPEISWSLRPGAVAPISSRDIGNLAHCRHQAFSIDEMREACHQGRIATCADAVTARNLFSHEADVGRCP